MKGPEGVRGGAGQASRLNDTALIPSADRGLSDLAARPVPDLELRHRFLQDDQLIQSASSGAV